MNSPVLRVSRGTSYFDVFENGEITQCRKGQPSGQWKITGGVVFMFGQVVQRYTLKELVENFTTIKWKYKNGKQRIFFTDLDHGTSRQWTGPMMVWKLYHTETTG